LAPQFFDVTETTLGGSAPGASRPQGDTGSFCPGEEIGGGGQQLGQDLVEYRLGVDEIKSGVIADPQKSSRIF
jgi:hypothetical protein